jgi:dimethylglycine dehydrogenase
MGYVDIKNSNPGNIVQIEILGDLFNAEVLGTPIYDASGMNMRS